MKQKLRPSYLPLFLTFCFLSSLGLSTAYAQSENLRMSTTGLKSDIVLTSTPQKKWTSTALFPKGKRINPPLPQLKAKRKATVLDAQKTRKLRMSSGTKIEIPANAFVDAKGRIVNGQVDFYYEEYNSGLDIMLSGIPMDFKDQHFESAAMFDLRAAQNGEPLYPNPEAPIEVLFPATPGGEGYSFYNYNEEKGEWIDKGEEELLEADLSLKDMWADALVEEDGWMDSSDFLGSGAIVNPVLVPGGLTVNTLKPSSESYKGDKRGLQFQFKFNKKANNVEKLSFSEWKKFDNSNWVFVGDQSRQSIRAAKKKMKDLNFEYWPGIYNRDKLKNKQVLDCWIIADTENDCFNFMVATFTDTLSFPVLPYQNGHNELHEQKRIGKTYRQYQEKYENRKISWQQKMANFYLVTGDTLYSNASVRWNLNLFGRNRNSKQNEKLDSQKRKVPRRVRVKTFGLCNIDTILRSLGEEILVNCTSTNGENLRIKSCYVWNNQPRTTLRYEGAIIQLPSRSGNRILLKFDDGKIATVNEKAFQQAYRARKENTIHLVVVPIREEEIESTKLAIVEPNR